MIHIAVCDDNQMFLDHAVTMINTWKKDNDLEAELHVFDNGDDLLAKASVQHMDIIILDIIMPLLNGIEAAKELRKVDTASKIIFLTTSPEFALESYSVKAQNYLLKPVDYHRLKTTLDECLYLINVEPPSIIIRSSMGYQKLFLHHIEFAEAQNKKVLFNRKDGTCMEALDPLYAFEKSLSEGVGFFKCHRSYIVNLSNIDNFNAKEITMKSGKRVPVARGLSKALQEVYFDTMFKE